MKSICIGILAITVLLFTQMVAAKPPSWDTVNNGKGRFKLLTQFGSAAVLDQETGLVWEQSPSTSTFDWFSAQFHCNDLSLGNRKGYRLPTVQELTSLVDPTQSNPALPVGHPFQNVQSSLYWSATTRAWVDLDKLYISDIAWFVNFYDGSLTSGVKSANFFWAWCVRGGQGVDPQ